MTPVQRRRHHHRHHERAGEPELLVNLGPVFTLWDRLAGSYDPTPVPADAMYGVNTETTNPVLLQLEGWRELARPAKASLVMGNVTVPGTVTLGHAGA